MKAVDKTSAGYQMGKDVLSKEYAAPKPVVPKVQGPSGTPNFHRISIEPADNGVTVEHTPKSSGKNSGMGGGDYEKATKKVFTDMNEAHAHIGKCLGCGE